MAEHDIDDDDFNPGGLDALTKISPSSADCLIEMALDKALTAKARKLMSRGSSAIIISVPSLEWSQLVARRVAKLSDKISVSAVLERSGRKKEQELVGADALPMLQRGRCIVFVSHDPVGTFDPAVLAAADMTISIGAITVPALRKVIRQVTGGIARGIAPEMAALPLTSIVSAIRPGISARECVANLGRAIVPPTQVAEPDVPLLSQLPLLSDLRHWADRTLDDLAAVADGRLPAGALTYGVLEGEPGTGKTLLARSLARTAGWSFVDSSVGSWFTTGDGALGGVARNLKSFIDAAITAQPAIAFLDELDALPDRANMDARGLDWWTPVVTLMLTEIDRLRVSGARVLLLGATNYYHRLDAALVRRLQQKITVRAPQSREEIFDLLKFYLKEDLADADLMVLAHLSIGATPARVEGWVREARALARGAERALTLEDVVAQVAPEDSRRPADIRAIAIHEVGHALVAHRLGHTVEMVSIVPHASVGGQVSSALPTIVPNLSDIHDMATVMLAGRAADLTLGGGANSGSESDLENATRLLIDAYERQGLGQGLLYGPAVSKMPSTVTIKAVASDLTALLDRAVAMLQAERDLAIKLAGHLITAKILSGDQVGAFLDAGLSGGKQRAPIQEARDVTRVSPSI
ncbi:Peptidase family M41 [Devosia crocina]|uniref:Peptidase family M41 n=1 Tax=Devosia crocina TaxID=429728 RepID=A0A1I7NVF0_9HYPH|nr:AAA family ATPase [Devosia crocina]SFV38563.1 Peptidase family M41 [Devosia crocina]